MKFNDPARFARSAELYKKACGPIPAGVNSTARAPWSGWDPYPLFVDRGEGAYLYDVDGNAYIDYLLGLGPMILGHCPPKVTAAVIEQIQRRGTVFALPTAQEALLAQKIIAAVPSIDQVRLCNTGTEAVIYSIRLARAFTGREKVIRFEGMYHGFGDGVYWSKHPRLEEAGPDEHPIAVAQGPGMPKSISEQLVILPWNDVDALRSAVAREGEAIAAILTEPVMCNTGCILPEPGYLQAMREIADSRGIVLIYDEVITGFRLGYGGAQGHYGIKPDISVFAKGLGGGYPVAALGGRRDIMKLVANGTVSLSGTYSANGIAVAAANAALDELSVPGKFEGLFERCARFYAGLAAIFTRHGLPAYVSGLGPVLQVWFTEKPIRNYRDAARHANHQSFRRWWEAMLERGVLFHPGQYENLFVSFAHSDADIDRTLKAADDVAGLLRAHV
jgi:glutamate-1-semialdehyde 2,1-aminomutase